MLYHCAVSLCCIIMVYHYGVSLWCIIMLYHYSVSLCCIIMLYHYAVSLCRQLIQSVGKLSVIMLNVLTPRNPFKTHERLNMLSRLIYHDITLTDTHTAQQHSESTFDVLSVAFFNNYAECHDTPDRLDIWQSSFIST
jgi:hypothetical protein